MSDYYNRVEHTPVVCGSCKKWTSTTDFILEQLTENNEQYECYTCQQRRYKTIEVEKRRIRKVALRKLTKVEKEALGIAKKKGRVNEST